MPRGDARNIQIRFNLTEAEALKLKANLEESGAPSRTAFLRAVALGPGWNTKLPAWRELAFLRSELKRQGENLNQIARVLNQAKKGGIDPALFFEIRDQIIPIYNENTSLSAAIKDQLDRLKK